LAVIGLTLTLSAGAGALAADPDVVTTAPTGAGAPAVSAAAPANDGSSSQIDAWVASDGRAPQPGSNGPAPRTIHGEVGASVGTGGYRNVYGVADIPVGQTGDLVVAASSASGQVRGGRYGGYGFGGDALALGFYSNGVAGSAPGCGRQPWGQPQVQAYGGPGSMSCGAAP
jgi:hypothetical protein